MPTRSLDGERILDEIHLHDLQVHCTIGIHPEEEAHPQLLRLNLVLYLDTRQAALSGRLQKSVDYSALACELNFILTHARFRLLESAAEALASYILAPAAADKPHASIEAVELEIIKPEALGGIAFPAIRIFRKQGEIAFSKSDIEDGLLFAAPEAALFRFSLASKSELQLELEDWQIEAALTGSSGLTCNGRELSAAEQLDQFELSTSSLSNNTEIQRSLLVIAHRETRLRPLMAGSSRPSPNHYN